MKKLFSYSTVIVLCFGIVFSYGCAKKKAEDQNNGCKTCKAYAAGPDKPEVKKEVCTNQAEQDFRSQYTGREISCQ